MASSSDHSSAPGPRPSRVRLGYSFGTTSCSAPQPAQRTGRPTRLSTGTAEGRWAKLPPFPRRCDSLIRHTAARQGPRAPLPHRGDRTCCHSYQGHLEAPRQVHGVRCSTWSSRSPTPSPAALPPGGRVGFNSQRPPTSTRSGPLPAHLGHDGRPRVRIAAAAGLPGAVALELAAG